MRKLKPTLKYFIRIYTDGKTIQLQRSICHSSEIGLEGGIRSCGHHSNAALTLKKKKKTHYPNLEAYMKYGPFTLQSTF